MLEITRAYFMQLLKKTLVATIIAEAKGALQAIA